MSKIIRYDAVEVVISIPTENGSSYSIGSDGTTHKEWKAGDAESARSAANKAEKLAKAINRTLGPYEDHAGDASTRWVSEEICGHCGARWTEKSNKYNGGCCDDDEAGNPEA